MPTWSDKSIEFDELLAVFDIAGVKYQLQESSDENGLPMRSVTIEPWVREAIIKWDDQEGYAGMPLEEYLKKMGADNGKA